MRTTSSPKSGMNTKPIVLFWFYILVNMAPSFYFALTQPISFLGKVILIAFPLGLYTTLFSLFRNTGLALLLSLPLLILHAFQIVLFYLHGEDPIAADMFLNVATTNTSEISELLGSLWPSIVLVCLVYIPPIVLAILQWKRQHYVPLDFRRKTLRPGVFLLLFSMLLSILSVDRNSSKAIFNSEVYPINILRNLGFAVDKWDRIKRYPITSKGFSFEAYRDTTAQKDRQIYVLVVGETSRADNWALYGYQRATNPNLMLQPNLLVFRDALTQSNTTHKSVSILLSDADASTYSSIYQKKGLLKAFKEAGFKTVCFSNQAENASFIEYFTKDADTYKTIRTIDPTTGLTANPYDMDLVDLMEKVIAGSEEDLFILLHSYGSHFNYMERYPAEFRQFTPDYIANVRRSNRPQLLNAYDNSILYTDYFLSQAIQVLERTQGKAALLYVSDHGEDLLDDARNKFLHASPNPTYYQLRIPFLMWFSDRYQAKNKRLIQTVSAHKDKPISSNVVFHTMLHMAHIRTSFFNKERSLLHRDFLVEPRMYLNDHDVAVPYLEMNLKPEDFDMLRKNGIKD